MPTSFDSFAAGDVAIFERRFSEQDFAAFSVLSGDTNPLHHDAAHAGASRFGRPIVPLHLTLAPLSAIAGTIFPGEPSLYLGHEVRAALPVHYGESLRYSARVMAVNPAQRLLVLRVLALRGLEVVLDAEMRVQATADHWDSASAVPILKTAQPGLALVTGASGAIGGAIALTLAAQGWRLLLQDRGDQSRRHTLRTGLERLGAQADFVAADLTTAPGRAALAETVVDRQDVEVVVHAASPPLDSPLDSLVAVNYAAAKAVAEAALPVMLARQKGRLLLIGSTAQLRFLPGWEDYAAAKTMAAGYFAGLDGRFAAYGVRAMTLLPGFVATPFSDAVRGDAAALVPQEVAAAVAELIATPQPALVLDTSGASPGRLGFSPTTRAAAAPPLAAAAQDQPATVAPITANADAATDIAPVVRRVLRLSADTDLGGGGIGLTPGWDSLRQIEIALALEAALNLRFSTAELAELGQFDRLQALCRRKMVQS